MKPDIAINRPRTNTIVEDLGRISEGSLAPCESKAQLARFFRGRYCEEVCSNLVASGKQLDPDSVSVLTIGQELHSQRLPTRVRAREHHGCVELAKLLLVVLHGAK